MDEVWEGDCLTLLDRVPPGSVSLVVFSPPYADQRKRQYRGVSEDDYPAWMAGVFEAFRPCLVADGSVFMNIRSHVRRGQLSDYVLKTRLELRGAGWIECEELIWHKPDAPPLGSVSRPRRTWESVLWYSRSRNPYCDLKAGGRESNRLGFDGSRRFGVGGDSPIHDGQSDHMESGRSRMPDVIVAYVGALPRGVRHPAMYPESLPGRLIDVFSRPGNLVLDPFCGSGQTLLAARCRGRHYLGMDLSGEYVSIARERLSRR